MSANVTNGIPSQPQGRYSHLCSSSTAQHMLSLVAVPNPFIAATHCTEHTFPKADALANSLVPSLVTCITKVDKSCSFATALHAASYTTIREIQGGHVGSGILSKACDQSHKTKVSDRVCQASAVPYSPQQTFRLSRHPARHATGAAPPPPPPLTFGHHSQSEVPPSPCLCAERPQEVGAPHP